MQSGSGSRTESPSQIPKKIDISYEELTRLWNQWIGDSSLWYLRFGQYVLNRYDVVWPECYYAGTSKAYQLLYEQTDGIPTFKQDHSTSSVG